MQKEVAIKEIVKLIKMHAEGSKVDALVSTMDELSKFKEKTDRKKSKYQEFMGGCMKSPDKGGKGKGMKDCVVEWNITKEKRK